MNGEFFHLGPQCIESYNLPVYAQMHRSAGQKFNPMLFPWKEEKKSRNKNRDSKGLISTAHALSAIDIWRSTKKECSLLFGELLCCLHSDLGFSCTCSYCYPFLLGSVCDLSFRSLCWVRPSSAVFLTLTGSCSPGFQSGNVPSITCRCCH